MNIVVATASFAKDNYDSFKAIYYAEEKNFSTVQLYMNPYLQDDKPQIAKIRERCFEKSIKILCHSSLSIGNVAENKEHRDALLNIFPAQDNDKHCIFHFDEKCSVEEMLDDCEKLIDLGLTPCIENFYIDKSRSGLVANIEKFLSLFDRIAVKNQPVLPVLDFPRLFIEQFVNFHPILLSELLIQKFAEKKIIIHAIDSLSTCQNRDSWCAIGHGIVDWINIFEHIKKQRVFVEYVVLEYENTDFIDESILTLNKYKNGVNFFAPFLPQ